MTPLRLLTTAMLLTLPNLAAAETWAEKLGYPADKRVVILHANYMGAAYEFNRRGKELLEAGHIQSASVMVPSRGLRTLPYGVDSIRIKTSVSA